VPPSLEIVTIRRTPSERDITRMVKAAQAEVIKIAAACPGDPLSVRRG